MTRHKEEIKVKVWGDDPAKILRVLDDINDLYKPNVELSSLKRSTPRGYHGFVTIYMEA